MSVIKTLSDIQHQILYDEYHKYLQKISESTSKDEYHLKIFFDLLRKKHTDFSKFTNRQLSNQIIASRRVEGEEEWPNISKRSTYLSPFIRSIIYKANNSALLAVEIFNKPQVAFRSESFIVLMMIAWTALFHAIFIKKGEKIQYNDSDDNYFDLRKCIKKYNGIRFKEISANLNLLVDIRDKIVHRDNPILDDRIFGHCQACLLNFQTVLNENFPAQYSLKNGLAYSLQFSNIYDQNQLEAIKKYKNRHFYQVIDFIKQYEDNLYKNEPEVFQSQYYSFRVYLIPKPVKENHAEAAIEYLNYDSSNTEIKEHVQKVIFSVKETRVGGNYYKAGEVCDMVYNKLKDSMPKTWKFNASSHHPRCAKYFKIREGYKTNNPEKTKKEYCLYDPVFEQYIYTKQWIDYLIKNLKNENIYKEIFKKKNLTIK